MIEFVETRYSVILFKSTRSGRNFPFVPADFAEFVAAAKRGEYDHLIDRDFGRAKGAELNAAGADVCPVCLAPRDNGTCRWCPTPEPSAVES